MRGSGTATQGPTGPVRSRGDHGYLGVAAFASWPATVALTALTLVTMAGLASLFQGASWVLPVLGCGLIAHGLAWGLRRARLGEWLSTPLIGLAALLVLIWSVLPHATFYGLPTGGTLVAVGRDLHRAHVVFGTSSAPVRALPGFVLVAGLAGAAVAALADWAAFRLDATFEAIVPAVASAVFISVLAGRRAPAWWLGGLVLCLGLFVTVHEAGRRASSPGRFTGGNGRRAHLSFGGAGLAALVAVGSVVVGPRLPGAQANPLISVDHRGAGGPSQRTTISPLVDIRYRLLNEADQVLFTVRASAPSYWTLTSLDRFDGTIWSSDESYSPVGGSLPVARPGSAPSLVTQTYDVDDLDSIWLPAAYLPTAVNGISGVSWDGSSDSLITRSATTNGQRYTVVSAQPHFSPAELRRADQASIPRPTLQHYLQLPSDVPANVIALARRVTAGATTPYDQALDLQNYLRDDYAYSLAVPPGHSNSAIEEFLFVTRRGYCEQFAGAYAVMARAIGLPTRVAVGFTPGQLVGDDTYEVLGLDAHAWPEVLLGRFGWVSFDPTPGRGMPGATSYTGVPAEQAGTPGAGGVPTTQAAPASSPASGRSRPALPRSGSTAAPVPVAHRSSAGWPWHLLAPAIVALAVLSWALGVPLTKRMRRRARRRRAGSEADRILLAWEETNDRLGAAGCARLPGETLAEHAARAARLARLGPEPAASLAALAGQAEAAAYGPPGQATGDATAARARADEVGEALQEEAGLWRRLRTELDPRSLVSRA